MNQERSRTVETNGQGCVYSRQSDSSTGWSVRNGLRLPVGTSGCGPLTYVSCVHMAAGMGLSPLNVLNWLLLVAPPNAYKLGHTHSPYVLHRRVRGYLWVTKYFQMVKVTQKMVLCGTRVEGNSKKKIAPAWRQHCFSSLSWNQEIGFVFVNDNGRILFHFSPWFIYSIRSYGAIAEGWKKNDASLGLTESNWNRFWGMKRRKVNLFSNHFLENRIREVEGIPFCMRVMAFARLWARFIFFLLRSF